MAYGDYNGPDKPNKGHEGGACNRTWCQAEPANHYNHGSMSWYCVDCKVDIGEDAFNKTDWDKNYKPKYGRAMFETREEIDKRDVDGIVGLSNPEKLISTEEKTR